MNSPFDELCALLQGLVGDLGATGALPEYKRNIIWDRLRGIREAHEKKSKRWTSRPQSILDLPKIEMTVAYEMSDHYQQMWQQLAKSGQCKLLDENGKEIGQLVDAKIVNGDSIVGVFVSPYTKSVIGEQQLASIEITTNKLNSGHGKEENNGTN